MSFLSISSRCRYGILATVELAKAGGGNTLTISQIANAQQIPARFLEGILRQLKLAGILGSLRGKQGGYFLQVCPKEVTIGQLFHLLESKQGSENLNTSFSAKNDHNEANILNEIFSRASNAYISILSEVTLSQFVEQINKQEEIIDYAI